MAVELGVFVVPDATDPGSTVERVEAADEAGLDLVGIQDHPYQGRFVDTFELLAYLAARTERIKLAPDVANLPLRPPTMLAKAAASIDLLSGGRFELGLGAGAFWERIAGMGGPARSRGESVEALEEAIALIRAVWSASDGTVSFEGRYYRADWEDAGPPPAHRIGIWLGAYGPRMLRLTGRLADGWLPSLSERYMPPEGVPERQRAIDEAARAAGRDPAEVRRAVNVTLPEDPARWTDHLRSVVELGFDTLITSTDERDPLGGIRRLAEEVAPALRQ